MGDVFSHLMVSRKRSMPSFKTELMSCSSDNVFFRLSTSVKLSKDSSAKGAYSAVRAALNFLSISFNVLVFSSVPFKNHGKVRRTLKMNVKLHNSPGIFSLTSKPCAPSIIFRG